MCEAVRPVAACRSPLPTGLSTELVDIYEDGDVIDESLPEDDEEPGGDSGPGAQGLAVIREQTNTNAGAESEPVVVDVERNGKAFQKRSSEHDSVIDSGRLLQKNHELVAADPYQRR